MDPAPAADTLAQDGHPDPGGAMGFIRGGQCGVWAVTATAVLAAPPAAKAVDKAALLKEARKAYYSLSRERMDHFRCTLVPDWKMVLQDQKIDPEVQERAIASLNDIRFTLTVDRHGVASVTHTSPAAENEQKAAALRQIYDGMEQMTVGFFQTWSVFMVDPPLPEADTPFRLEELGAWHILRYEEAGGARIETTLARDFSVSATKVVTGDFQSTITPSFARTAKGYVLVGYQATYRTAAAAEATDLTVTIENQEVGGLTLPRKMDLGGSYGGKPFHVVVSFVDGSAARY